MPDSSVPYWLIHEVGKTHGFATVDLDSAVSAEAAVAEWRRTVDPGMLHSIDMHGTEVAARLMKPLSVQIEEDTCKKHSLFLCVDCFDVS